MRPRPMVISPNRKMSGNTSLMARVPAKDPMEVAAPELEAVVSTMPARMRPSTNTNMPPTISMTGPFILYSPPFCIISSLKAACYPYALFGFIPQVLEDSSLLLFHEFRLSRLWVNQREICSRCPILGHNLMANFSGRPSVGMCLEERHIFSRPFLYQYTGVPS